MIKFLENFEYSIILFFKRKLYQETYLKVGGGERKGGEYDPLSPPWLRACT